jgi:hypothetical protein
MTSLLSLEKSHHWLFWNFKQNKTLRFSATDIGIFKSIAIRFTFPSYIQIPITNDFFSFLLTCEILTELLPGNGDEDLLLCERLHANNFHTSNNIVDFIISLISICFEFGINFCIVVQSAFSKNWYL